MDSGLLDVLIILAVVLLIGLTRWAWNYIRWGDASKALFRRRRSGLSDPDRIVDKLTDRDWDHYDGRPE